jgi:hypothetical protein
MRRAARGSKRSVNVKGEMEVGEMSIMASGEVMLFAGHRREIDPTG